MREEEEVEEGDRRGERPAAVVAEWRRETAAAAM